MVDKLLTGKDVADILNISKAFAYRMMAKGEIPVVKLGRSVRVRPVDLQTFISESVSQGTENLFAAQASTGKSKGENP